MGGRLKARRHGRAGQGRDDRDRRRTGARVSRRKPERRTDRDGLGGDIPGHIDVFRGFLALLMAIVGLVLLIACVNLSGMMLARAAGRRREIAVRLAIGRVALLRLARQLLTETALLFATGGVLGVLVSRWLRTLLMSLLPQLPVPLWLDMPIDTRVLAFAIVLSLVAGDRLRSGARAAGFATGPGPGAEGRRSGALRRTAPSPQRVSRRPGGDVAAAGARRGALHAHARTRREHSSRASIRRTSTS